jgi:hypothetical protein
MSSNIDANTSAVAHHIADGAVTFPYAIDAHHAVSRFPHEWSHEPWIRPDEKVFDMTPLVLLVGSDKGGVGKTMIARALLDFLRCAAQRVRY